MQNTTDRDGTGLARSKEESYNLKGRVIMKPGQILEFPKEQSARVRVQAKVRNQKAVLALSILSVVILSVITNQFITRPRTMDASNRGIASVGSTQFQAAEVRWEHALANELSNGHDLKGHIAERPSLRDELLFGTLEGRYGARLKEGRVLSLELLQSADSPSGISLSDRSAFLSKYKNVLAAEYSRVGLQSKSDTQEIWSLVDEDRTVVGQAKFSFDAEGRVSSLTLE